MNKGAEQSPNKRKYKIMKKFEKTINVMSLSLCKRNGKI